VVKKIKLIVFYLVLAVGIFTPLAATAGEDVEGSEDHPLISRFPGAWFL